MERDVLVISLVVNTLLGQKQAPETARLLVGNVETLYRPQRWESASQDEPKACVGLGYRKKRMLLCNGADTRLNVTGCESKLTFDW